MDASFNEVMQHIFSSLDAHYKEKIELAKQKFAKEKKDEDINSKNN